MSTSTLPALPDGWVQQYDAQSKHPFWVDTNAKPPRSIWIHPYEDEQYLNSHPDMRDRIAAARKNRPSSDNPPPYSPRRHSISGESGRPGPSTNNLDVPVERRNATSQPGTPPPVTGKRGFFDRLKDKASGRDDQSGSRDRGLLHHRHHQSQQAYGPQYGRSDYAQPTHYAQQPMYGPPAGDPYAVSGGRYRRGFGG
ncbi:hypothetical protein B0H21DRAFT_535442 [Amylocystis lapponica]|nr:hypothetical protein B0H21DRAFT_535442 [Amylocystis lapponica]